jgi:peroxiredoxin
MKIQDQVDQVAVLEVEHLRLHQKWEQEDNLYNPVIQELLDLEIEVVEKMIMHLEELLVEEVQVEPEQEELVLLQLQTLEEVV